MIKKSIIIILTLLIVLTMVGCSSKAQQEEIDALKAEIEALKNENKSTTRKVQEEQEIPTYKDEGVFGTDAYITLTSSYTEEGLAAISRKEGLKSGWVYFFMPNAPKVNINEDYPSRQKVMLPDEDYCIAIYEYDRQAKKWKKFK